MSAIDSLPFHADGNSIRARFASRTVLDPWTSKAALIQPRLLTPAASLRRETNRQACFISPSAERPIVRRFDTRGKTRAGFRGGKARCPDWYITSQASRCAERRIMTVEPKLDAVPVEMLINKHHPCTSCRSFSELGAT